MGIMHCDLAQFHHDVWQSRSVFVVGQKKRFQIKAVLVRQRAAGICAIVGAESARYQQNAGDSVQQILGSGRGMDHSRSSLSTKRRACDRRTIFRNRNQRQIEERPFQSNGVELTTV